jgi:peptide/nickel transport system substrate-binding protein
LTVEPVNAQIGNVTSKKDFDLACWGYSFADSSIWRQIGFNFMSDSPSNRIGYNNPEFDAAIDEMYAAPNDAARRAAIAKMSELFVQDQPFAVIGAPEEGLMIDPSVTGIVQTQQTMFMFQDASIGE